MKRYSKQTSIIAEQWQLALLAKAYETQPKPSENQRRALVIETGLDEAWIRNCRRTRTLAPASKPFVLYPPSPTNALVVPKPRSDGLAAPIRRQISDSTSNTSTENRSEHFSSKSANGYPISGSRIIAPTELDIIQRPKTQSSTSYYTSTSSTDDELFGRSPSPTLEYPSNHWISQSDIGPPTRLTYSRDPLYNRYPDFSQFFLPKASGNPFSSTNTLQTIVSVPAVSSTSAVFYSASEMEHPMNTPVLPRNCSPYIPLPVSYLTRVSDVLAVGVRVRENYPQMFGNQNGSPPSPGSFSTGRG
ncbi:hypothetical protein BJ138DRAFT_437629 [Hygrophoropsis aurantiaca]|uniref:Uncharacterized protein n=1 Tax=Hygrophoropsis aurantiaca TaxID=72124 RepID=A0ACB8AP08_9AGAM|nr:hypothetical protein BJ138DRAFT_437629 [Hygrophoropsis aurantiaca]